MIELVDYIRLLSRDGRLVTAEQVIAVAGLELEIEDVNAAHQELIEDEQYADILMIMGKEDFYFYSKKYIVKSYAEQWIGINDGELLNTMANYIRRYAVLGELTAADNFTHPPYNLNKGELAGLIKKFQPVTGYEDIKLNIANDGTKHFFSTNSITVTYAAVLADVDPFEWSA